MTHSFLSSEFTLPFASNDAVSAVLREDFKFEYKHLKLGIVGFRL